MSSKFHVGGVFTDDVAFTKTNPVRTKDSIAYIDKGNPKLQIEQSHLRI